MGKGSAPRTFSVTHDTFASNWDAIFGKKEKVNVVQQSTQDTTGTTGEAASQEVGNNNGGNRPEVAINNPNTPSQ